MRAELTCCLAWYLGLMLQSWGFVQAAEERSLSGQCGNPICRKSVKEQSHLNRLARQDSTLEDDCLFCRCDFLGIITTPELLSHFVKLLWSSHECNVACTHCMTAFQCLKVFFTCTRMLQLCRSPKAGKDTDIPWKAQGFFLFSSACELPVRRLAGMLGNEAAALARFSSKPAASVSEKAVEALNKPKPKPQTMQAYAAGGSKLPIMLASVKVSANLFGLWWEMKQENTKLWCIAIRISW